MIAAASLAVVLVVAGVAVAFNRDTPSGRLEVANSSTTSTSSNIREIPGVFVSTTTPVTVAAPTGTTTTTRPRRVTTTSTTAAPQTEFPDAPAELVCAQTTPAEPAPAPSDWASYWTTKPAPNNGLDLKICVEDATPKINTTVKLYVLAQDPDAEIGTGSCDIFVRWDSNDSPADCPDRDGVTAPPDEPQATPSEPKQPCCRRTMTYVHEYSETGEFIIDVNAWSGPNSPERHPYASYNSIELRVNVHR